MFDVFQTPWLLLSVAMVLLGVVFFWRQDLFSNGGNGGGWRGWGGGSGRYLLPLIVAALAFGLDYFVRTDREKIVSTVNRAMDFAVERDFEVFNEIFSPDYSDRHHRSRERFRMFCRTSMAMANLEQVSKRRFELVVSDDGRAECEMSLLVRLNARSGEMAGTQSIFWVEVRIGLKKTDDARWMISGSDLVTVNHQPFGWSQVP